MPTIIKVHEVGEANHRYVNADYIVEFYTCPDDGQHTIIFSDKCCMEVKESPDEIAALIAEAMNPLGSDYKLPEWAREREADPPEGDTLYEQHLKNFQKWYGDPTPGTSASNER